MKNDFINQTSDPSSLVFTYGMCCNALLVVHSVGLINLLNERPIKEDELYDSERYPNSIAIKGALQVLNYGNILQKQKGTYWLTSFGKEITHQLDGYLHWFEAYGKLLSKSVDIANDRATAEIGQDFFLDQVTYSASLVKNRLIIPMLKDVVKDLNPKGSICDLGCGTGETLIHLCDAFGVSGIGFDKSYDIVDFANKHVKMNATYPIHIYYAADYLKMNGVYPEIDLVISDFITHHIASDQHCIEFLQSLTDRFPNSRYLILMDTITPDENNLKPEYFAPAFDYIHRLQRLETRGLASLINIIKQSNFKVINEIKLDVPYSYAWILKLERG